MADATNLPDFFEPLLSQQFAAPDVERILRGCTVRRPVTLRANTLLASRDEVAAALDASGIAYEAVSWYGDAFIIRDVRERAIWDLPIYQEGKVYLQSLSSMIPALALDAQAGEDVCDMCAAPGGKTTQIAALAPGAYITACEMHAPRAEKLRYNLEKLGVQRVNVMQVDARRMDDFFSFDRVLLDVPCSGSGTLVAGDARMAKRFTPALLQKSRKSQRALFAKALAMLKPGATLVYSTCSVLACENEDIIEEGLRQAARKGTYELLPIVEAADEGACGEDPFCQSAHGQASADESASRGQEPAVLFGAESAQELPLLPTHLPGCLCLAPDELYEGFFVAKIKRFG